MIYSLLRPTSFCVQIIVFALWVGSTHAQQSQTPKPEALPNYPSKAVRLIIPSAPGGGTDMIARVLAQKVSKTWGQPVIVENKSGGGTRNGTHYVAKQPPDGYTLISHAALTGPFEMAPPPMGDVTYTANSINAVYALPHGSGGQLWWKATEDMTAKVSFDYLITGNSSSNMAYVTTDGGLFISLNYTDGLTQHFTDTFSLLSAEQLYVAAFAGSPNSSVYLSHISVSDANAVPIPAAVWLLGTGLVGLFGVRRRMNI
jgi:hypothetical protein